MNITPEQITKASRTGLQLLPNEIMVPHALDDLRVLKAVLGGLASGQIVLGKPAAKAPKTAKKKARTKRQSRAKSKK